MAELVNQIALFIESLVEAIGYPGITLVMLAENLIPPIPTEPLLPFAGMLIAHERLSFPLVLASAVLGAMIGTLVLYWIGRRFGEPTVRAFIRRYGKWLTVEEAELDRALALFNKYGGPMVFVGRLIPVLRAVTSLTAGISHMPLPQFILYSAASSALSSSAWILSGYILGENWPLILDVIDRFEPVFMVLVVAVVAFLAFTYARRLHQRRITPLPAE